MIARIWRGRTPASKADDYFDYLQATGVEQYGSTEGNQGVLVLRQTRGEESEFLIISLWDSYEAIQRFAGENPEIAVYYPEDGDYLLEFEPRVQHYEVLARS